MSRLRGFVEAIALVVAAFVLCWVVGALNPLHRPGVNTDTLGPDQGETVGEYVARAAASVGEPDDGSQHWALVSFDSYLTPERSILSVDGVRVAQVVLRVPIEHVQTRVIPIGVPGSEASVRAAAGLAARELNSSIGQWDRQSQIDAASARQLAHGCSCVVGLVVRATSPALAEIGDTTGVRAVEALPADARAGHFAVRAFLPDYTDVVGPLPDDGEIPPP